MVGAFGAGPQQVEFSLTEQIARVDGVDPGAEMSRSRVVRSVGGDGHRPVVDGGHFRLSSESGGGFNRPGAGSSRATKQIGNAVFHDTPPDFGNSFHSRPSSRRPEDDFPYLSIWV